VLVDRDGAPVLSLHPLVQVARPAPGAPAEIFLYAGRDLRGGKLSAAPLPFELGDALVLDWLQLEIGAPVDESGKSGEPERPPFRGLDPFTAGDADDFFGRERLVDAFVNRLRVQPLLAVVGESGAGKSSFVHAGVVPALRWRTITLRPGAAPLTTLAARLEAHGVEAENLAERLAQRPHDLRAILRDDAERHGPLLLVIDQLEELFTLTADDTERGAFAAAIAGAARTADDPVRVVLTLRDDFLVKAEGLAPLRDRLAHGLQLLTTPERADLERILCEPLRRAGYEFADPELPARMVEEVSNRPGALALLSFTAARLWERRDRAFRRIPTRAYEALGGVGGALARHAEALLGSLPAERRAQVRRAFLHLVTAEGTRAVRSQSELLELLGGDAGAGATIDALIDGRLLVAYEGEDGEHRIEVTHEALLSAWPRLVTWLREDAESARLRDQLRDAAKEWERRGRPRALLWRAEILAELERWRARQPHDLTHAEAAFADASRADATRGRRIRHGLLLAAFAVLAVGLAILFSLREQAERARSQAHAQLVDSYEEHGRRALLEGDPRAALAYLAEAYYLGASGPAIEFMLARALEPFDAELATFSGHEGQIWATSFSPDGARILTSGSDGTARIWDATRGDELLRLSGHAPGMTMAVFSPDGRHVATSDTSGAVRLWHAATGALGHELERPGRTREMSASLSFSPDGLYLAVAGELDSVRLFDVGSAELVARADAGDHATMVEFDAAGERIVTAAGLEAIVFAREGERLATLRGHEDHVWYARFSPDGARVATASMDGTARVWDAHTGAELLVLRGHDQRVTDVVFSPSGERLATVSADRTARLWDTTSGELRAILRGHGAQVNRAAFTQDERLLITIASDGITRVWDVVYGLERGVFAHAGFLFDLAIAPDDQSIATASWLGTAKRFSLLRQRQSMAEHDGGTDRGPWIAVPSGIRNLSLGVRPREAVVWNHQESKTTIIEAAAPLLGGDLSHDDKAIVLSDDAGWLRLYRASDGGELREFEAHRGAAYAAAFDPTGRLLASAGADATVALWDARTGEELARTRLASPAKRLNFSPDGRWLLAHDPFVDTTPTVLASSDLDETRALPGHAGPVFSAAFSPNARYLATVSTDGTARIWNADLELDRVLEHESPLFHVAWSTASDTLLIGSADGTANLWRTPDWERARFSAHDNFIAYTAFSPDGALVATSGGDSKAHIWAVADQRLLLSISTASPQPSFVWFDAAGESLVVAGSGLAAWPTTRTKLAPADLWETARCRTSRRIGGGQLQEAPDDPSCTAR
jgi:WD40 repeat protein